MSLANAPSIRGMTKAMGDNFIAVPRVDPKCIALKWFTEFGLLNRGDMLTSEHYRCLNEKKKFQRRV